MSGLRRGTRGVARTLTRYMVEPLDSRRLLELRQLNGMTPGAWDQIVVGLIASLGQVVERVDQALARDDADLGEATQAAHLGRNDALMVGSGELAGALAVVEQAARDGDAALARREFPRVTELWPSIKAELERLLST